MYPFLSITIKPPIIDNGAAETSNAPIPLATDDFIMYLSSMNHNLPHISAHSQVSITSTCKIIVLNGENNATIANIISAMEMDFFTTRKKGFSVSESSIFTLLYIWILW